MAALLAIGLIFGGGILVGHDLGVAEGEAKVRHYQSVTSTLPLGYSVTTEKDGTIIVRCPAEDSCTSAQDGRKIIVSPRIP